MVINKSLTQTLTSSITLSNTDPVTRAAVYRYSAANLNAIVRQADQAITSGSFNATLPGFVDHALRHFAGDAAG